MMEFKLIMAIVTDDRSERVVQAARNAGATGVTIISGARGEGLVPHKTFLGLDLLGPCDAVVIVAEQHASAAIMEAIAASGEFDTSPGAGIAIQLPIEATAGLQSQIKALRNMKEKN